MANNSSSEAWHRTYSLIALLSGSPLRVTLTSRLLVKGFTSSFSVLHAPKYGVGVGVGIGVGSLVGIGNGVGSAALVASTRAITAASIACSEVFVAKISASTVARKSFVTSGCVGVVSTPMKF